MPRSVGRSLLTLLADTSLLIVATVVALVLRENFTTDLQRLLEVAPYLLATGLAGALVFASMGTNRAIWRFSALPDYGRLGLAVIAAVLLAVLATFAFDRLEDVARSLPILQAVMAMLFLVSVRVAFRQWHVHRGARRHRMRPMHVVADGSRENVVVVGVTRLTETYLQSVNEFAADHVRVVGLLGQKDRQVGRLVATCPVLGRAEDVEAVVRDLEPHGLTIDRIVVAYRMRQLSDRAREALLSLERSGGIELVILPDHLGFADPEAEQESLDSEPLRFRLPDDLAGALARRPYWSVKRAIDVAASLVLLILLFPVIIVGAVAVALTIGLPVAFWQQRPGLGGHPFRLYKLRTMRAAHDHTGRRLTDAERVSVVGDLLRRTRIDELPQLFNILRGDMSFIGPRPLLPRDQSSQDRARLLVRPGLTGWAQVIGGREISADDKAALDVWYVKSASFRLDVEIALRTIPIILFGERIDGRAVERAWRDLKSVGIVQVPLADAPPGDTIRRSAA